MPVNLNIPVEPVVVPSAQVAAFKVEEMAGHWVDVWVVFGTADGEDFIPYVDPITGDGITPMHVHIEDGVHPLAPDTGLRKCPSCGKWWRLETQCDCEEATVPYDGFSRIIMHPHNGILYTHIKEALYGYLLTELVPDPTTWEERPLLDGVLI